MLHREDEDCIELNQKYETTFNNIRDAVFLIEVDENNEFYYELLNSTQKKLTGLKNEEVQQKTPEQVLGEELGTEIEANCRKCLQQKQVISYQRTIDLPSGKKIWATKLSPVIIDGEVVQIAGSSRDITEIKAKEEKIEYISFHDELTGLYNRRYYEEEIKRLDTKRKLPISLIVGDVNGLKLTNDVFGHEVGDELLKKAGQVLQESTRHEDVVARWGGDEYCIILPQTNVKEAKQIVKRIINNCTEIDFASIPLSIEFGVATKTDLEKDMNQVFAEAEENMYQKKKREKCKFDNKLLNALLKKLKQSNYEVVNHTNRMLELAVRFADQLGFSPERKRLLCKAVQFHDIGILSLPQELRRKKEYNQSDFQEFREHCEDSYKIVNNFQVLSPIANDILCHHEYWDGSGYPEGLAGQDIPLLARIITILDFYDAVTYGGVNHDVDQIISEDQITKEQAIDFLQQGSGQFFDPQLIKEFIELIR